MINKKISLGVLLRRCGSLKLIDQPRPLAVYVTEVWFTHAELTMTEILEVPHHYWISDQVCHLSSKSNTKCGKKSKHSVLIILIKPHTISLLFWRLREHRSKQSFYRSVPDWCVRTITVWPILVPWILHACVLRIMQTKGLPDTT